MGLKTDLKSIDLNGTLQEAFSKLIEFSKFLFALVQFFKAPRLEEFLNELGKRFQHKTALCLKDYLSSSSRSLNICRLPKIIIRLRSNCQISKRVYASINEDIKTKNYQPRNIKLNHGVPER